MPPYNTAAPHSPSSSTSTIRAPTGASSRTQHADPQLATHAVRSSASAASARQRHPRPPPSPPANLLAPSLSRRRTPAPQPHPLDTPAPNETTLPNPIDTPDALHQQHAQALRSRYLQHLRRKALAGTAGGSGAATAGSATGANKEDGSSSEANRIFVSRRADGNYVFPFGSDVPAEMVEAALQEAREEEGEGEDGEESTDHLLAVSAQRYFTSGAASSSSSAAQDLTTGSSRGTRSSTHNTRRRSARKTIQEVEDAEDRIASMLRLRELALHKLEAERWRFEPGERSWGVGAAWP